MEKDKGIVSILLMDGTSKTLSLTNKTTADNLIQTILQKVNGVKLEDFRIIIVSRTQPEGTPLESNDLILEIQHSWGDKNINGNRFKLVNVNAFVRIMFKGITEIADGIMGGLHATPNMTTEQFTELIVSEYNLNKKKKYHLYDVMSQGPEEKVIPKDEKPLNVRNNAEKTYGMKPTEFYFQFSPKKDSFFSFNVSKAFKFKEKGSAGQSEAGGAHVAVSSPQLLPKIIQINFDEMPDNETIDKQLLEVLEGLNITGDLRDKMMKDDPKRKWTLICQHKKPDDHTSEKVLKEPHQYIENLSKKNAELKTLVALRVELSTASVHWVKAFLESSGLSAIQIILTRVYQRSFEKKGDTDEDIQLECMRCVRGIFNTEAGLKAVYGNGEIVLSIVHCLHAEMEKLKTVSAELLAGLCIVSPKGHSLVLDSFGKASSIYKEQSRFQYLVTCLSDSRFAFEFRVMTMSLINAIVNAPENISIRIRLRQEFSARKLPEIMQVLRVDCPPELTTQLNVYSEESEADSSDASSVFQQGGFNISNPAEVAAELVRRLGATSPSHQQFLSILQSLLMIPHDQAGHEEWIMADLFMQKVNSLQGQKSSPEGLKTAWVQYLESVEAMTGIPAPDFGGNNAVNRDADLEAEIAIKSSALKDKDGLISTLNSKILTLELQLGEAMTAAQNAETLMKTISILEARISSSEAQNSSNSAKSSDLASEIVSKSEEIEQLTEQIRQMRSQNAEELQVLSKEIEQLHSRLREAESDSKGLKEENEKLKSGGATVPAAPAEPAAAPAPAPPPPAAPAAPAPPAPGPPPPGPPPPPGAGPPPPPGAPGLGAPGLPAKKVIKPNVNMKQLNWTKLANHKVSDTLWKGINDEDVKINVSELEQLFQKAGGAPETAAKPGPAAAPAAAAPAAAAPGSKKPNTVTLLEFARANNIAIMLARIKLSYQDIKKAILEMNEEALTIDNLRSLKQFTPTEEELETIRDYDGDAANLGNAEKFFLEISTISNLAGRLDCMIFKRRFEHDLEDLKPDVDSVVAAVKELRNSKQLAEILKICLAIGNYLNGSTFRGGAYGFKLDALLKLNETKSNGSGPSSLLHYVAKYLEEKNPKLLDFLAEMPHLADASRVSLPMLLASVRDLKNGVSQVQQHMKTLEGSNNAADKFAPVMMPFVEKAQASMNKLSELTGNLEADYKALLGYFGEDDMVQPEEFFSIPVKFSTDVKRAVAENKVVADAAKSKQLPGVPVMPAMPAMQQGELDNALRGLKEGNAFRRKRENRRSMLVTDETTEAMISMQKAKVPPPIVPKKLN